jgi:hypothetical protein
MTTQEGTLSGSNTGGASGSKALSVPQIRPVFSFHVEGGGLILVYVFDTSVSKMAIATLDDGYSEEPYAVSAITDANTGISLVYSAIESFEQLSPNTPNPFRQLAGNKQAMRQLNDLFASIFGGE